MTRFTWTNCWADIRAASNDRTIESYMRDVVGPAVAAIDEKIGEFDQSAEGWAPFAKADMEDLRAETIKAFALAIQSLWERQLRSYVSGCATDLKLGDAILADAQAAQWHRVERAFVATRGIRLSEFPSYGVLSALHLLGNVCRHGDGPSVGKLHALRPDFWPDLARALVGSQPQPLLPSAGLIRIEPQHLRTFADAISGFWDDVHYIYLESLTSKHESVVTKLEQLRASRAWLPQL